MAKITNKTRFALFAAHALGAMISLRDKEDRWSEEEIVSTAFDYALRMEERFED